MKPYSIALVLLLIFATCAPLPQGVQGSSVVNERLYFGRNVGDSLMVTDSAWTEFLSNVITPRFPNGLSTWRIEGQWRNARGMLEREPSFIVEFVHPVDVNVDEAVTEIINEYKRRFHQEAVLRLQSDARATF